MKFVIEKIIQETPDTKTFVLKCTGEPPVMRSGQFLTFRFYDRNGEEHRRSYSISSSPELGEDLTITVKRISNGAYSRLLHDILKVGDELDSTGVSGFFLLPDELTAFTTIFFFAAGSGIAPVYGMIKTALHIDTSIRVVLIYSNRAPATTVFLEKLESLQTQFPTRFAIEFLFSSSHNLLHARLNIDLVERMLRKHASAPYHKHLFYLCGPYDYMRMVAIKLLTTGVPEENIRREIFFVQKVKEKILPEDTSPHKITVQIVNEVYSFVSQYPSTILNSAKQHSVPIPYSCEAGQCGTCATICVEGTVWMSHNEVLLDEETERGAVLTCTGYAIKGDVVLKL